MCVVVAANTLHSTASQHTLFTQLSLTLSLTHTLSGWFKHSEWLVTCAVACKQRVLGRLAVSLHAACPSCLPDGASWLFRARSHHCAFRLVVLFLFRWFVLHASSSWWEKPSCQLWTRSEAPQPCHKEGCCFCFLIAVLALVKTLQSFGVVVVK